MKERKIYLIRHAESESNTGKFNPHDNVVKITENGKKQAQDLVEILDKPDRIIVSKYIRTIETAEPTIKKFPESEVHLWQDAHEFGWIGSIDDVHPDIEVMRQKTFDHFTNFDPYVIKENNEESFHDFVLRIHNLILKMNKIPDGINYIFTHAFVIKMIHFLNEQKLDFSAQNIDYKKLMQDFAIFNKVFKVPNTKVLEVTELIEKYAE